MSTIVDYSRAGVKYIIPKNSAPARYATVNADTSATILAAEIRARDPFFFVRYGDGALECIRGKRGQTCDREAYSDFLGAELRRCWESVVNGPNTFVGDWLSASFDSLSEHSRYAEDYAELVGDADPTWLHFEALLLMRESAALVDFYRAVKEDPRRKMFMGPAGNAGAARMLGAEFIETPMENLLAHTGALTDELITRDFDVLLYGAGMAGNIPAIQCWERFPERTYVNLGSAMDPLFRGRSRRQQIPADRARRLFSDLL
jgi:hypothetical protein